MDADVFALNMLMLLLGVICLIGGILCPNNDAQLLSILFMGLPLVSVAIIVQVSEVVEPL